MCFCGICSVSFRNLQPEEIINATADAGLVGIEWGSDVHIPPGAIKKAKYITALMKEKGMKNLSYGTYFGVDQLEFEKLEDYLKTAQALETDIVRIWAPSKSRSAMSDSEYSLYVDFMQKVADKAASYGITVCFECHCGTLVENPCDALQYLKDIDRKNVKMYWQPNQYVDCEKNLQSANMLSEYIVNVHVFHWKGQERFPLSSGLEEWSRYKKVLDTDAEQQRSFLLEFMHDDSLGSLKASADTLHQIVASAC